MFVNVCICAYFCVRSHNPNNTIFSEYAVDFDVLLEQFNRESVRNVLQIQSTLPPPPKSASYSNVGLIVGVVVALIAVLVILLLLILAIVGYWVQKSRR